jgi:uncharacterized protein (TIRG00374 family)
LTPAIVKPLKTAAKIIISCLALYFVFRNIDPDSLWDHLKQSNLVLLVAGGLFFVLSKIISAYRLNYFFRSIGVNLSEKLNLRLYWLGMFYNLFLPGGIGGDGFKVYYLHKNFDASVQKSLLAILFDRLTGLISLGFLCILFALFLPENIFPNAYLIICMVLGIFLFYFVVYRWFRLFYIYLNVTNLLALGTQISQVISARTNTCRYCFTPYSIMWIPGKLTFIPCHHDASALLLKSSTLPEALTVLVVNGLSTIL